MRILYFAQSADAAGCREENWPTEEDLSIEAFWSEAVKRHPQLSTLQNSCRLAVDGRYAAASTVLHPDAEVAVIPPVSGG